MSFWHQGKNKIEDGKESANEQKAPTHHEHVVRRKQLNNVLGESALSKPIGIADDLAGFEHQPDIRDRIENANARVHKPCQIELLSLLWLHRCSGRISLTAGREELARYNSNRSIT